MFSESGWEGQGVLGRKSERAATKARLRRSGGQYVGDEGKFLRTFSQRLKIALGKAGMTSSKQHFFFLNTKSWNKTLVWKRTYVQWKDTSETHYKDFGQECRGSKPTVSVLIPELIPHARFAHTRQRMNCMFCATYNNIGPYFLRRDGLRGSVSYHSVMKTTNQCRLQQIALFLIKAGKMRQITDLE